MVSLIARSLNELRIAIDLRTCHRNEIHAVVPHKGLIGERHSLVKLLECGIDNAVVESFACAGLEILRSYAPAAKVEVAVSFTPKLYEALIAHLIHHCHVGIYVGGCQCRHSGTLADNIEIGDCIGIVAKGCITFGKIEI